MNRETEDVGDYNEESGFEAFVKMVLWSIVWLLFFSCLIFGLNWLAQYARTH